MKKIRLKPTRETSLLRHHPWLFSGAIAKIEHSPEPGETVLITSHTEEPLALAAYSPHSQITARVWSFDINEPIDASFFRKRLARAIETRRTLLDSPDRTACRLVNGEADGLPGLIVDRYDDFLVLQSLFTGIEYWKDVIRQQLSELFPCRGIYERSDASAREKEKLPVCTGSIYGETPPELIKIREGNALYYVDIMQGHKTGFYLDQQDSRAIISRYCKNKTVLNCFSYTGAFSIAALISGATQATNIDSSKRSLELATQNAKLNNIDITQMCNINNNAFEALRELYTTGQRFDIVILDPPKFAESKNQMTRAARAYKDINLQGFKLLNPGGLLFTFSCSGALEQNLFQKIVADAALDAGREAQILMRLSQAEDHPIALSTPEGFYLKGLICKAH